MHCKMHRPPLHRRGMYQHYTCANMTRVLGRHMRADLHVRLPLRVVKINLVAQAAVGLYEMANYWLLSKPSRNTLMLIVGLLEAEAEAGATEGKLLKERLAIGTCQPKVEMSPS